MLKDTLVISTFQIVKARACPICGHDAKYYSLVYLDGSDAGHKRLACSNRCYDKILSLENINR